MTDWKACTIKDIGEVIGRYTFYKRVLIFGMGISYGLHQKICQPRKEEE